MLIFFSFFWNDFAHLLRRCGEKQSWALEWTNETLKQFFSIFSRSLIHRYYYNAETAWLKSQETQNLSLISSDFASCLPVRSREWATREIRVYLCHSSVCIILNTPDEFFMILATFFKDTIEKNVLFCLFPRMKELFGNVLMQCYSFFKVLPPTVYMRVTDNIPLIISFIKTIISSGQAYATSQGKTLSKVTPCSAHV